MTADQHAPPQPVRIASSWWTFIRLGVTYLLIFLALLITIVVLMSYDLHWSAGELLWGLVGAVVLAPLFAVVIALPHAAWLMFIRSRGEAFDIHHSAIDVYRRRKLVRTVDIAGGGVKVTTVVWRPETELKGEAAELTRIFALRRAPDGSGHISEYVGQVALFNRAYRRWAVVNGPRIKKMGLAFAEERRTKEPLWQRTLAFFGICTA